MSRTRIFLVALAASGAITLSCVPAIDSAEASPLGLRFSATSGPVFAPGPNAAKLGNGLGIQIEAARRAGPRLEWFGVATYADYGTITMPEVVFGSGGSQLYLPPQDLNDPFRNYGLELGLRRRVAVAGLDLFVEGAAGLARSEQPDPRARFTNDRRPDPAADEAGHGVSGTGASFSLGAGGVIARNGRVGLVTAASARWLSAVGVAGPMVPLRVGLVWPVALVARVADAASAATPSRGPRLRLGAGTAWMDAPANVWKTSTPAAGFSAGVEWPMGRGLALRLDGAQVLFVSSDRAVLWQETDVFGNLHNIYSDQAPHWTTTFLTVGVSAGSPIGRWTPYLHAGGGLGRTGGDGSTIATLAYVPPGGPSLTPLYRMGYQGLGSPQTGVAWSGGAGLEFAVAPAWNAFVEGTMLGVNLDSPDVQVFALRMGVVLR